MAQIDSTATNSNGDCNSALSAPITSSGADKGAAFEAAEGEGIEVGEAMGATVDTGVDAFDGNRRSVLLSVSGKGDAFEGAGLGIEGKTVVVGIRMDSRSREILTWALVNVAVAGDRVVALHILAGKGSGVDMVSLAKDFDAMLSVYEGFCNLKQIDLKLKICKGKSIRKVLIREASAFGPSKLILGVALCNRTIGCSALSMAKYCAKKLSGSCSVLALKNGKVVFEREATENSIVQKKSSQDLSRDENGNELNGPFPVSDQTEGNVEGSEPSILLKDELIMDVSDSKSSSGASPKQSCSLCSSDTHPELKDVGLLELVEFRKDERLVPTRKGWWELIKFVLSTNRGGLLDKPKNPTIQWPVRISNRSSLVHPDQKSVKSDGNKSVSLDCNKCEALQVATDVPNSPIHNHVQWSSLEELESFRQKYSSLCRLFSFEELEEATSNFSAEMLIGKGGSSSVYKGFLPDGKELAVKALKASEETLKEFISEIEILTSLQHKNIISIRGFCADDSNLMLVYDYISKGCLEDNLHGEEEIKHVLSWHERYKIAMGVAEALSYLHEGDAPEPVIHRDVKSSNILISEDLEPQLSDFGLAKWSSATRSLLKPNDVAGTFGYLAPEYVLYGKVNEKVDVYAFGIVLLELLSGRKPISTFPSGNESIVMWAKPILLHGDLEQIVDPCLGLGDDDESILVERMMLSASLCTRRLNQARPQMSVVLKLLMGDDDAVNWARNEVNSFKLGNSPEDEVTIPDYDIQSHLSLALLDTEDDFSISSSDHATGCLSTKNAVENYMQWRSSQLSSFN